LDFPTPFEKRSLYELLVEAAEAQHSTPTIN
jgi:hypothetical protein